MPRHDVGRREGHGVSGDAEAAELFETFYPRLAGWCRGLVDNDALAHEVASEAFTRLWSRWSSVEEPRPYLYTAAANIVKNHWRSRERERRAVQLLGSTPVPDVPPADQGADIRDLVAALPERLRVPVLLRYYADLPVAEIAQTLHRREGTVKSDLHKARERLRASLREVHEVTT
jgi:RNA polymerase sigma-70 factor (ECF subfamily)